VPDLSRELSLAVETAREAGALLRENFGRVHEVEFKGRINLVTEMDRRSERLIVDRLHAAYPDDDVLAEEGSGASRGAARRWIVDPLDGTTNYAHEYPVFSVSIALAIEGRPQVGVVYNPLLDEVYAARRGEGATLNGVRRRVTSAASLEQAFLATGFAYDLSDPDPERNNTGPFTRFVMRAQAVRRAGSAALAIAKVGVGRTDGFWEHGLHAWDMAAAMVIVEEGGGRVTGYDGRYPDLEGRHLVATNGQLHEVMLEVLAMRGAG
jgi:myo-inositol-1(or 4)-monophosphatase